MEAEVLVQDVEAKETRGGNKRYVVRDADGKEYTTFRPAIGEEAMKHEGRRARIQFHEEERNGFNNVYLDRIEQLADQEPNSEHDPDTDVEEAAWRTAIEAAPWLMGANKATEPAKPEEVFDKLKPFQDLVADDIRDGDDEPERE